MDISVVIPVYGCRKAIYELYARLSATLKRLTDDYEIIFINDSCPQNSWEDIEKICNADNCVVGISLSRNFGQHKAILAGLDICKGESVVVMDCDLQDRPEHILELYDKLCEGYDIVWGSRVNRKDSIAVKALSKLFYKVCGIFTDKYIDPNISNFSISKREVILEHCKMREVNRDFSFFQQWMGYETVTIELESDERAFGHSSYGFVKKVKLAVSIITSQSNKPLYIAIYMGMFFVLVSVCMIVYYLINFFILGGVPTGWTSLIVSMYLLSGITLLFMGTIGIYIGNIFEEVKNRPLYIVKKILNKH